MNKETFSILLDGFKDWARTQKRVTNKTLRDRFNLTEDEADEVYKELKAAGVIGCGGYPEVEG